MSLSIYDIVLCLLIGIYLIVVCGLIIRGYKMIKGSNNKSGFTYYQRSRLDDVRNRPGLYKKLKRLYDALNSETRYGRVLRMDGSVEHAGFSEEHKGVK